jgi:AraC family transcriptional regulator
VDGGPRVQVAGRGEIEVWEGASLWLLRAQTDRAETAWHRHHAMQVTFSLEGSMELHTASERLDGKAIAVKADTDHVFNASGRVAFLFVEPESPAGRAMAASLFDGGSAAEVDTSALKDMLDLLRARAEPKGPDDEGLSVLGGRLIERITRACAPPAIDRRVSAMIDYASANLDKPLSLASATAHIGLSPSRLRHLFVAETGQAFKTYILWLRLRRALDLYAAGATLTDAAHEAGFADSAHLSRVFRRTFGVPATALQVTD